MYVNLGRVYVHQFGTRIHTIRTTSTLINSSFGTRIGTSIWDAYPYTKLGRVYYVNLGRQFGTRIRSWYAYMYPNTHKYTKYTHKSHKTTQNDTDYTKIYTIYTNITENFIKTHKITQKNHTGWVTMNQNEKYSYIQRHIYIYKFSSIHKNVIYS